MQRNRPLGVTIISILAVIGGIGSFLSGLAVITLIPILGIILGGILVIIGLAYFAVAYGLERAKLGLGYNFDSICNRDRYGFMITSSGKHRSNISYNS
jgi:hypothetical protein